MSDPRLSIRFEEIKPTFETFAIDDNTITYDATKKNGSDQVGLAVTMTADTVPTVQLAGDGEAVVGKLIGVEKDGYCTVQTQGNMTLPAGTSATLTRGKKIVGDLLVAAEGYIREVDTATAAELGVARGFIIDPSTTTAVVVKL